MLWDSEQGAFAREYLASRGLGEEVCRQFRLGYAPGGPTLTRRALQEGFTQEDLLAGGLVNRRGNDYFARRLVFPLADARGAVRGFQARKLLRRRPAAAEVRELAGERPLQEGRPALRPRHRAPADREAGPRGRRRGEHRRARASAGRLRAGRRVDGHRAHRAPAARAEPPDEAALPLLRLRRRGSGRDAARHGARGRSRASTSRSSTLPKGTDPADDPAAFEQRLHAPVSYPVHRVRLLHERAVDKNAASAAIQAFLNSLPDSPEHLDARRLAADLLDLPPETQAAFAPIRGRSSAASVISPRLLDAGRPARAQRARRRRRASEAQPLPRGARPRALRQRAAPARTRAPARAGSRRRRAHARCSPRSTRSSETDEITRRRRSRCCFACASGACSGSSPTRESDHFLELQQRLAEVRTAIREFA